MKLNLTGAKIQKIVLATTALILVLIPFHTFFSAWLASNFGHYDLIRVWKEILLLGLVPLAAFLVLSDKEELKTLKKDRLVKFIGLFFILLSLRAVYGLANNTVSPLAVAQGLIIDARFFLFLLIMVVAFRKIKPNLPKLLKLFWLPALLVVVFGLVQYLLPNDFLKHFGYGPETLRPFQAVDNKPNLARLQSTLRGPNPLGAYLVVVIGLLIGGFVKFKKWRPHLVVGLLMTLAVLYGTYSRSAFIGAVIAAFLIVHWSISSPKVRKIFWLSAAGLVSVMAVLIFAFRNVDMVQDVVFHTSEKSTSAKSANSLRAEALESGWKDVLKHPLGQGVGSAGPASVRNKQGRVKISENFYLQIGQETGVLGLILFAAIIFTIGWRLWLRRDDMLARVALACLAGLVVINLVSHAWADDTLAYVLFGLVGLALAKNRKSATLVRKA